MGETILDPPIKGLEYGVEVIRPVGSFKSENDNEWWDNNGGVLKSIIAGERECFREDIVGLSGLPGACRKSLAITGSTAKAELLEVEPCSLMLIPCQVWRLRLGKVSLSTTK